MKALTLWPEWAWAVSRLGKNVENRPRRTKMEPGTVFAIHAGASWGGSDTGYKRLDEVFAPVDETARRAGWRIGVHLARNVVQGYNINAPLTFEDSLFADVHTRAVVAVARFGGLLEPGRDDPEKWPWWDQQYHGYILSEIFVLPHAVASLGQQGFWNLKEVPEERVQRQIQGFV